MNKTYFAIVLHFHQPVGNFTEIFDRAYERCYRPFLEFLPYYPDIKMTLHISGSLIDYLQKSRPEILKLVKELASKGQVEIMGGAYYEPILSAIPQRDIKGQIMLMSKALRGNFGVRPRGAWVPERVWRPELIMPLSRSGARYCVLDDTHFIKAGLKKEETHGYFTTGGWFNKLAVFPSDKMLRYTIPFKEPRETIDYLKRESRNKRAPLFVYADDVEKLGEWPGTYEWVYEKGWLKSFFDLLMKNREWITLVKLSDYIRLHRPLSKMDIPEASYEEMMKWSEGSWFNFLKKYPESGHMYRKMHYVSRKVEKLQRLVCRRGDKYWANIELYRGQCNCGYWHGAFGGLYMYHLRSAIYNHLIAAENIVDNIRDKNAKGWTKTKELDFNADGRNKFIIENNVLSAYFDPEDGGALKELDYRPICVNLVNSLARRREPYHEDVEKEEPALSKKLIYDKYTRSCLRDYFLKKGFKRGDFISAPLEDYGSFSGGRYIAEKKKDGLILRRKSFISGIEIEVSKDITVKENVIEISYVIKKSSDKILDALFGTEFNLTMPFLDSYRYRYFSNAEILGALDSDGVKERAGSFSIRDAKKELDVTLEFSKDAKEVHYFPVETVSKSLVAYRSNFQCSCIFPIWNLNFNKDDTHTITILLSTSAH